jgi:hypothetical protein
MPVVFENNAPSPVAVFDASAKDVAGVTDITTANNNNLIGLTTLLIAKYLEL